MFVSRNPRDGYPPSCAAKFMNDKTPERLAAEEIHSLYSIHYNTAFKQPVAQLAEIIAKHFKEERDQLKAQVVLMAEALKLVKEKGHLGFHNHWDDTMQRGMGCPHCQEQRIAYLAVMEALSTTPPEALAELEMLRRKAKALDWMGKQPTLAIWSGTFADSEYNIKLGRVGGPIVTVSTMDADGAESNSDEIGSGQTLIEAIEAAQVKEAK